ncbi:MAG: hypothetical protein ACLP9L_05745 [Thermoguttaceae bacterium]
MEIFFQSHPDVIIGGNTFRNVKTILQFENIPLLEVGRFEPAGYSERFPVFNMDGVKVAVVVGRQIHLTEEGSKARIVRRCEPNLSVCELEGKPILELRRNGPTALRGWAELYAPEGLLIRALDSGVAALLSGGNALQIGGMVFMDSFFDGCPIGIHIGKSGHGGIRISIGAGAQFTRSGKAFGNVVGGDELCM